MATPTPTTTTLAFLVAGWYAANAAAASGAAAALGRGGGGGASATDALALLSALQLAAAVGLCALLAWRPSRHSSGNAARPTRLLLTHAALRACLLPGALFAAGTYFTNAALAAGGVGLTQAIKAAEPLAAAGLVSLLLSSSSGGGPPSARRAVGSALAVALLAGGAALSAAGAPKRGGGSGGGGGGSATAARAGALAATVDAALSGAALQLRNVVLTHFQRHHVKPAAAATKQPPLLPGGTGGSGTPAASPPPSSAPAEFLPTCAVGAALLGWLVLARRAVGAVAAALGRFPPPSSPGPPPLPASPAALALAVGGFAAYQALSFTVLRALDPVRHAALGNAKRAFVAVAGAALAGALATGGEEAAPRRSWPSAGVLAGAVLALAGAHCHAVSTRGAVMVTAAPAAAAAVPTFRPGALRWVALAATGLVGVVALREVWGGWRGGGWW